MTQSNLQTSEIHDPNSLLESWRVRCDNACKGHYSRSEKLFNRSDLLGYVLIYSTVFSTAFSLIDFDSSTTLFWGVSAQVVIALIGCIAAVISGIVTQARYGERAEIYRSSGAGYANLAREIEELQMKMNAGIIKVNDDLFATKISDIVKQWNTLSEHSLLTPHTKKTKQILLHFGIALIFVMLFYFIA